MILIDLGDAMVETKQMAPGTRPDSIFQFGLIAGSPAQDAELARWLLVAEPPHE
jgi:hypothetical protein